MFSAGPDDSSAWLFASSFARAPIGADRYSGFQAFSVGSHHFVGALDADRLGGENSYRIASFVQAAIGRSSYWPPLVISTKTMRATLLASATAVRLNLYLTVLRSSMPLAHRRMASLAFAMAQRRAGAHHQKLAQVAVAHLGDPPEPRFAAGRVL